MAESRIDPALLPYLQTGLQRAQELFLTGPQPTFFPGQTYVAPSEQTLAADGGSELRGRALDVIEKHLPSFVSDEAREND